jgi:hypothetical protein
MVKQQIDGIVEQRLNRQLAPQDPHRESIWIVEVLGLHPPTIG